MRKIIRPATEADIPLILKIHVEAFQEIGFTAKKRISIQEMLKQSLSSTAVLTLGGSTVAGYYVFRKSGSGVYLNWFAVLRKYQGHNYGEHLLNDLEVQARKLKAKHITLDTRNRFKSAMFTYLRKGYEIVGTWVQLDGDIMISMRKSLK